MRCLQVDERAGFRWFTFGRGDAWLKIGPVTLAKWDLGGPPVREVHFLNRLAARWGG